MLSADERGAYLRVRRSDERGRKRRRGKKSQACQTCSGRRPSLTSPFTGLFTPCDWCRRPAEHLRPGRSRIDWRWREILRITKRTQSCAKRAGSRFCRRNFMDWLYRRSAKLEQERASGVTWNLPETAIIPRAGWSRNNATRDRDRAVFESSNFACVSRERDPRCHSDP